MSRVRAGAGFLLWIVLCGAGRRFAREGSTLLLYCDGMHKPLRFVRKEP